MLNNVKRKIPNNLGTIINERGLTIADLVRLSGMTRPTVVKLVEGEDSYLSKMAAICESIGISMSEAYSSRAFHQENHAHDNSSPTMIGYQFSSEKMAQYEQRIRDLETLLKAQDKLIKMYEEKLSIEQNK